MMKFYHDMKDVECGIKLLQFVHDFFIIVNNCLLKKHEEICCKSKIVK